MTKFYNISNDNTLGGNSASHNIVASQRAVKEYVDNHSGGGGNINIIHVDTICYEEPNGIVNINENLCFDIYNNYFIYYHDNQWEENTGVSVTDGMIIYSEFEDAYYIYDSTYGLKPLSKGKSYVDADFDNTYYYIKCYLPLTDSFGEIILDNNNMGSSCYMNIDNVSTVNYMEFFEKSIGTTHTICIKNNKTSDVDITINLLNLGSCQGFLSSGLDSNNSFTVKSGDHAEISVQFKNGDVGQSYSGYGDYAIANIIVKTDFDSSLICP